MNNKKVITLENFKSLKNQGLFETQKIVFTNGCFDILHSGHVLYLEEAAALGDILILGLNSDKSVKRLKGDERPINDEIDRAIVLAGLSCIDYIIIFEEDTPLILINIIKPDILVKGGDWDINDIVGSDIVINNGGVVKSLLFREGKSTTEIIKRIKKS